MAAAPEEVLPRLVDPAMELAGGEAAGLSLFEPDSGAGVFRWRHLQKSLSPLRRRDDPAQRY
jgi:hypothetical protein